MHLNTSRTTVGSRSLLHGGHGGHDPKCTGAYCVLFNVLVVIVVVFFAVLILAVMLYKKWKLSRAIKSGSLPAEFVISQWLVLPKERGDLAAFSFPVHQPKKRDEVDEESCPICLKERPKPTSWLVFGACNHATCISCFKRLVSDQKLHAACPICRTMLAKGEGNRGKNPSTRPAVELTTESATTTTTAAVATTPLPLNDNNV